MCNEIMLQLQFHLCNILYIDIRYLLSLGELWNPVTSGFHLGGILGEGLNHDTVEDSTN